MMKLFVCSLSAILLLPGCGLFKKKPKPVEWNRNIRLAGRIHKVDQTSRFVLIRRYGPWRVGSGEVVESRGEGRTANLLPTGERLGEHVAADIRSGTVEAGDGVYIRKTAPPEKPEKPEKPETSTKPEKTEGVDSQPDKAPSP
ncbi:MAG: hypothetical protein H7A51_10265 [Akkermansiaceae bacterium]|nr:hypothetical protein [Akkermansiaceae bacterium]